MSPCDEKDQVRRFRVVSEFVNAVLIPLRTPLDPFEIVECESGEPIAILKRRRNEVDTGHLLRQMIINFADATRSGQLELDRMVLPELSFLFKQFLVRSLLDDPPFFENHDVIRILDRGKAMCNHDNRPSLPKIVE